MLILVRSDTTRRNSWSKTQTFADRRNMMIEHRVSEQLNTKPPARVLGKKMNILGTKLIILTMCSPTVDAIVSCVNQHEYIKQ
jgi:hypothetical protein